MATWHQMKNPVQLWHPKEWTVVIDPPHRLRCCVRFKTERAATRYRLKIIGKPISSEDTYVLSRNDVYIIAPHKPKRECI